MVVMRSLRARKMCSGGARDVGVWGRRGAEDAGEARRDDGGAE
jgi:hypothetical protein